MVGSVCRWGRWVGVVGSGVSKMEEIKTSVAWASPRNHAMTWCFRCVLGVLSVLRSIMPGLISSVLDTWRAQCAVPTPEQSRPWSKADRAGVTRGRSSIVVDEGLRRQSGFEVDPRRGLIIRDETGVEGSSLG